MRRVLQLRGYRRLLIGTLLNQLATEISAVALSLLVYRRTGSALGASAFFLCVQFGPALLSPPVVARLDQRSARLTLVLLYALEVAVFIALAWLAHHYSTVAVLALTLVMGTLALVARVLTRAAWTEITSGEGLLREAQAITNTMLSLAYMAGPAIGGAVVAVGGTRAALLVNAGVFLVMAVNILTSVGLPPARTDQESARGRVRAAVAYARAHPLARRLLGLQGVALLFFSISIPVEVVFARHSLHTGSSGYGGLLSAWGAGAVLGSGVYARWRAWPGRVMMVFGSVLFAAGFACMAAAPSLAVALVGSGIAGVGEGVQFVAARNALQEIVSRRWMALMLSFNESLIQAVFGAGILLGGAIAATAGPRAALAVGAAGSLAIAAALRLSLPAQMGREPSAASEAGLEGPDTDLTATAGRT